MTALAKAKYASKEMITKAKQWLRDQYADENISDIGLEEILYEDEIWKITLSFYRKRPSIPAGITTFVTSQDIARFGNAMKVVSISDDTGEIVGMQDRILE